MPSSVQNKCYQVLDENDNSPVLDQGSLKVFISEDTKPGNIITKISATDADEGEFGVVTYAIDSKDGQDSGFSIDPMTGEISLTRNLDRETESVHR